MFYNKLWINYYNIRKFLNYANFCCYFSLKTPALLMLFALKNLQKKSPRLFPNRA